ncbi:MAG: hypothetical protein IJB86_00275 [Clostridia bacterium]|nr:hypothetical protein [Clostridia bacterium]
MKKVIILISDVIGLPVCVVLCFCFMFNGAEAEVQEQEPSEIFIVYNGELYTEYYKDDLTLLGLFTPYDELNSKKI